MLCLWYFATESSQISVNFLSSSVKSHHLENRSGPSWFGEPWQLPQLGSLSFFFLFFFFIPKQNTSVAANFLWAWEASPKKRKKKKRKNQINTRYQQVKSLFISTVWNHKMDIYFLRTFTVRPRNSLLKLIKCMRKQWGLQSRTNGCR